MTQNLTAAELKTKLLEILDKKIAAVYELKDTAVDKEGDARSVLQSKVVLDRAGTSAFEIALASQTFLALRLEFINNSIKYLETLRGKVDSGMFLPDESPILALLLPLFEEEEE